MRISGFASGLDIDDMVKKLMAAKKAPLNKLNQQKDTLEWTREQYRDINIKLVDFRNNKLFNYGLESGINAKQVNLSGNTTAVSAKAVSGALPGSMSVEVTGLATASLARTGDLEVTAAIDGSQTLDALGFAGAADPVSGDFSISIGGNAIVVNKSDTLRTAISKINADVNAKVNVFLDEPSGKMSVTSKVSGAASAVDVSDSFFSRFKLSNSQVGSDANLVINGIATTRSSNTFTLNGVELTLNALSGGTATNLNVVSSTDKTVDTIKAFIADYNSLLDTVNSKLNEDRYRKYTPLTTEQKAEMKESEITMWEEKAKSGLLRREPTLTKLMNDVRLSTVTDVTINGDSVNMNSLGIATGAWQDRGKLVIQDEAKLRAAIESNPDQVMKFFTQSTTETDPTLKGSPTDSTSGLFNRLSSSIMNALNDMAQTAGTSKYSTDKNASFLVDSSFGDRLRQIDVRISDENARMDMLETQYYKQFTAMETAMNRYSSQSSSLFGASQ